MARVRIGRAALVAFAVGCWLIVPAAPAVAGATCPTSDPCIAVHLPGGDLHVVSGEDITSWASAAVGAANGVSQQQYQERIAPGEPAVDGPLVNLGLSVNALLQHLGIDPSTVFTEMPRPLDGSLSSLTSGELAAPSSFQGQMLPTFYLDGDNQIFYARPLRNDDDVNASDDEVESPGGGALEVFVNTGSMLQVTASQSATQTKPAQPVTFSASATPNGESPVYTWSFSDGRTRRGQHVTHQFAADGTYEVLVSATGADDSFGAADQPLYVTVDGAAPSHSPDPSPTPGGGHSSPPTSPKPGPTAGHGNQPSGTPRPQPTPTPSAPATPASRRPGSSASPAATARSGQPTLGANRSRSRNLTTVFHGDNLPIVRGRIVGDGAVVLTGAAASSAQAGAAPVGRLSGGWRAAGLVGSIAAIMLLFAAGAARELRWSRRARSVVRPR